jgi:Zn-dependent protease
MLGSLFNNPILFFYSAIALLAAISIHEFAHAWMADRLGDPNPRLDGRLTLNPLAHLDLVGTLLLLIAHFGWGKPVRFDPYNLKNPRRDAALISLAGAAANMMLAALCAIILRILPVIFIPSAIGLFTTMDIIITGLLQAIIVMNVSLGIFNLIPIHPLDGFKVVEGLLPENAARQWHQLESLGYIMLFIFVFPLFGSSAVLSVVYTLTNAIITFLIP